MEKWQCPHCEQKIQGLDPTRVAADARRHFRKEHPEHDYEPNPDSANRYRLNHPQFGA